MDECSLQLDNCGNNSQCINTFRSFLCRCNHGYTGNGVTCVGTVQLSEQTTFMHGEPSCLVTKYFCFIALDIDECSLSVDNCHANANCTNTDGSFLCNCDSGYTGNGTVCAGKNTGGERCSMPQHFKI